MANQILFLGAGSFLLVGCIHFFWAWLLGKTLSAKSQGEGLFLADISGSRLVGLDLVAMGSGVIVGTMLLNLMHRI